MADVIIVRNRLYQDRGLGIVTNQDRLGAIDGTAGVVGVADVYAGSASYEPGDTGALTVTPTGRLRVDASPTLETVNAWAGNPWPKAKQFSLSAW